MRNPLDRIFIGPKRHQILERHNWYRNLHGGYTHPHMMDFMTRRQILRCTPEELEYKMKYGSESIPPESSK